MILQSRSDWTKLASECSNIMCNVIYQLLSGIFWELNGRGSCYQGKDSTPIDSAGTYARFSSMSSACTKDAKMVRNVRSEALFSNTSEANLMLRKDDTGVDVRLVTIPSITRLSELASSFRTDGHQSTWMWSFCTIMLLVEPPKEICCTAHCHLVHLSKTNLASLSTVMMVCLEPNLFRCTDYLTVNYFTQ